MKKSFIIIILLYICLTGCTKSDPLREIKRMARSNDLKKKQEASKYYKIAIDTLFNAYKSMGSLNKAVGEKLMFSGNYKGAIEHLTVARDVRNNDGNVYHWLGVCYVNLYKIEENETYLLDAQSNYEIAYRLLPDSLDVIYSYAHLLVYGKNDYEKAIELLNRYINELSTTPDKKVYFLLGRIYYLNENYRKAYQTFNELYRYKKKLSKEEKNALQEFILETGRKINNE